jgi:hypothetical protein
MKRKVSRFLKEILPSHCNLRVQIGDAPHLRFSSIFQTCGGGAIERAGVVQHQLFALAILENPNGKSEIGPKLCSHELSATVDGRFDPFPTNERYGRRVAY